MLLSFLRASEMNSDDSNTVTPTDQTPSPPPEAPTVSQHFNSLSADVTLISQELVHSCFISRRAELRLGCSGMLFKTHLRNLAACSEVFEGMLEVGNDETKVELRVEESAATLSLLLPYAYPASLDVLNLDDPEIGHFLVAVDKYSVRRTFLSLSIGIHGSYIGRKSQGCYQRSVRVRFARLAFSSTQTQSSSAVRRCLVNLPTTVITSRCISSLSCGPSDPTVDGFEKPRCVSSLFCILAR